MSTQNKLNLKIISPNIKLKNYTDNQVLIYMTKRLVDFFKFKEIFLFNAQIPSTKFLFTWNFKDWYKYNFTKE